MNADINDFTTMGWLPPSMTRVRRTITALAIAFAVGTGAASAASGLPVNEAQIESAFLYSFTKFIEWPVDRFEHADTPLVMGLLGDSPIREELEAVVKGRKFNGREIIVRRVVTLAEVKAAHVVFVTATEDARFAKIRASIQDSAVLLVGESPDFLIGGGTIRFVVADQRLRFEINASAADRAHLKISSQLQKLATAIHRDVQ